MNSKIDKSTSIRSYILTSTTLVSTALGVGFFTCAAAAADDVGLEEIIVTAQKRSEDVQTVPISITVISAAQLENENVHRLSDIQALTPGIAITGVAQGSTTDHIEIRGIESDDVQLSSEQPVAVYVDGVYQSTSLNSTNSLGPDLERVEILKGPQGTLYGRNTIGGAVNIISKQPTDQFEGYVGGGYGNYNRTSLQAGLNVPIIQDVLDSRFSMSWVRRDGISTNLTTDEPLGSDDAVSARVQLLFKPSESFSILFRADYSHDASGGNVIQPWYLVPGSVAALDFAAYKGLNPSVAFTNPALIQSLYFACGGGQEPNLHPKCYSADTNPAFRVQNGGASITAVYDISDSAQFKSITAWSGLHQYSPQDYDASPAGILSATSIPTTSMLTEEVQVTGSAIEQKLKYAAGVFFYHMNSVDEALNEAAADLVGYGTAGSYLHARHLDKSAAPYTQATYSIVPDVHLTGGIRYTKENKYVAIQQLAGEPDSPACSLPINNAQCVNTESQSYSSVDYTAGVDWQVTPDLMLYAKTAKGFQAGGINERSAPGVPFVPFKPETATDYEAGIKSSWLEHRLLVNVSVYHTIVDQAQKQVAQTYISVLTDGPISVISTVNAAKEIINGFEFQTSIEPIQNFRIDASAGYVDPRYDSFVGEDATGAPIDLSHTDFRDTPKWTFGLSPSYTNPVAYGSYNVTMTYHWQSSIDANPLISAPLTTAGAAYGQGGVREAGYGLLDARVTLNLSSSKTDVSLWAKNLSNQRYFSGALDLANSLGVSNIKVGDPLTVGIEATKRF